MSDSVGNHGGNLVNPQWLAKRLDDRQIVIADCRFQLDDPNAGRAAYDEGHIPGAVYFDLDRDLSGPQREHGGRHPLPDLEEFCEKLGAAGIDESVTVVCYDDQKASMATRLWWMLRYLGHSTVALLDGGYAAWERAGLPVTTTLPQPLQRQFTPRPQADMMVSMAEVQERSRQGRAILVDARTPERHRGESEPIDPVAGHIPGSSNLPWPGNVEKDGRFKPADVLQEQFSAVAQGDEVIVYCGSGVSACVNLFAMETAGLRGAKLYVGSWSDWCSYPDNPVATWEAQDPDES